MGTLVTEGPGVVPFVNGIDGLSVVPGAGGVAVGIMLVGATPVEEKSVGGKSLEDASDVSVEVGDSTSVEVRISVEGSKPVVVRILDGNPTVVELLIGNGSELVEAGRLDTTVVSRGGYFGGPQLKSMW